jgi:hypothetical protein
VVIKDQILVSDSWLHSVFMFDFDGVMKSRFGFCGTGHGNLMTPKGIAVGKRVRVTMRRPAQNI